MISRIDNNTQTYNTHWKAEDDYYGTLDTGNLDPTFPNNSDTVLIKRPA